MRIALSIIFFALATCVQADNIQAIKAAGNLPLFSSWQTGANQAAGNLSSLAAQLDRIEQGEYLLPVFQHPVDGLGNSANATSIARLAVLGLPFSMRINNAADRVVDVTSLASWTAAGTLIGKATDALELQYPNPPLVIMADNNEGVKAKAGTVAQFAAMHAAWDAELSPAWRAAVRRVGYQVGPISAELGRSFMTLPTTPTLAGWDGGSPSALYIKRPTGSVLENDTVAGGPQFFAMNISYGKRFVPVDWWQELGAWHGDASTINAIGLTSARYEGLALFGLFTVRPEIVREFLGSTVPFATYEPMTRALYRAVKRIHEDPLVKRFWEQGENVISPHENVLFRNLQKVPLPIKQWRDLLLVCPLNPPLTLNRWGGTSYGNYTWGIVNSDGGIEAVPVFAAALQIANQEFLIYAHAPMGPLSNVPVSVPGYGNVVLDSVPPEGKFFHYTLAPWVKYDIRGGGEIELRKRF